MTDNGKPADGSVEDAVDEIAQEAQVRLEEATQEGSEQLQEVQDQMRELRREMVGKALVAKDRVVEELYTAAQRIRSEVADIEEDEEAVEKAAELAEQLDKTASYLEGHTFEEVSQDVDEVARENVWRLVITVFFVGFVVGLIIGSAGRKK